MSRAVISALLALCIAWAGRAGAQVAISALPAAATLTGTEVAPIVQGGVTSKASVNQIAAFLTGSVNTWTSAQTYAASLTAPNFVATSAGLFFASSGSFQVTSDGVFRMWNNAGTDFGRLQFGGYTASFPSLKRVGAGLAARLADDSGDANLSVQSLTASGVVKTVAYTVATLPSAVANGAGSRSFVTDATVSTFFSIAAGGGVFAVPVFSDGVNWRIG